MHFYYFKAAKNYRDTFKLIYIIEIEHFNSHLYFYYINNRINPLAIIVDLSQVPPIIKKRQSHTKLPEKLWDRTKQIEEHRRAISPKSQPSTSYTS